MTSSRTLRTAIGVLLAATVAASSAQASIPGPDGVIHGCYGAAASPLSPLSVIDSTSLCPAGTNPLSLNAPSDAVQYRADVAFQFDDAATWTAQTKTRAVPLPPGDWAVTAHLELFGELSCELNAGTQPTNDRMSLGVQTADTGTEVTLTTTVHVVAGNELRLSCVIGNLHAAAVVLKSLVAVRVGHVTIHDGFPEPGEHLVAASDVSLSPVDLAITARARATLVRTFYSRSASQAQRQRAQIALLADRGKTVAQIGDATFASDALIRSVIGRYLRNSALRAAS